MIRRTKLIFISRLMLPILLLFSMGDVISGTDHSEPLKKARKLIDSGYLTDAIIELNKVIRKFKGVKGFQKTQSEAYYLLAKIHYNGGNKEAFEENISRLFTLDPEYEIDESDDLELAEKIKRIQLQYLKRDTAANKRIRLKEGNKRKKRFPVLLVIAGSVAVAVVVYLLFFKKKEYTVTVTVGEGAGGNPRSGSYRYKKGSTLAYSYTLKQGYSNLKVTIDGTEVSTSGTLSVKGNHSINVVTNVRDYAGEVLNSIEFAEIPAGQFNMGDNFNEGGSDERPVHLVNLDGYKISKNEITFNQYDLFCEATGRTKALDDGWGRGQRPVINVTWSDAKAFCDWLRQKTGKQIKLPTEAQWEKAARGTAQPRYPWGDSNPDASKCNYGGNANMSVNVGSFPLGSSVYGINDMTGNVSEWCMDRYDMFYYQYSPSENPQGATFGTTYVIRGGAWNDKAFVIRAANRFDQASNYSSNNLGFRIVQIDQ